MKIFETKSKEDWKGIGHCSKGAFIHSGNIAEKILGKEISYGNLFAYMVRRFGYPTIKDDSYKKIANWLLTTPMEGVWLLLDVCACEETSLHFGEAYSKEVYSALNRADREHWEAFHKETKALAEKDGISIVNEYYCDPEGVKQFNKGYNKWEAVHYPQYASIEVSSLPQAEQKRLFDEFRTYNDEVRKKYMALVNESKLPLPGYTVSHDNNHNYVYTYHHPLFKEVEAAMTSAISDLLRPTYVRDIDINALGHFKCSRACTTFMPKEEAEQYECGYNVEPWKYSGYGVASSYFKRFDKKTKSKTDGINIILRAK